MRKSNFYITFWGTRGSISTPGHRTEKYGGNTACVSVDYGKTHIILDAGTGIRNLGIELARETRNTKKKLDLHLLLSHTHWDHIQGIPFFEPAYMNNTSLKIYGSPNKEIFLDSILSGQMDVNYFPVAMTQLASDISIKEFKKEEIKIGSVKIDWQEQVFHPGGSVRYRLRAGAKSIVYASDVELNKMFPLKGKNARTKTLAREYCDFIKDADLLIADGQYIPEQYESKQGYGHTDIQTLINVAYRQGVKQLAVFHHEPLNSDRFIDSLWQTYAPKYITKKPSMNIFWAREGMTLAV